MSDLAFQMQECIKSLGEFLLKSWHYGIFSSDRIASVVSHQWPTTTVNAAVSVCGFPVLYLSVLNRFFWPSVSINCVQLYRVHFCITCAPDEIYMLN